MQTEEEKKASAREACKRWRAKNKAQVAAYNAAYRSENALACKAQVAAYDTAHREERRLRAQARRDADGGKKSRETANRYSAANREICAERARMFRRKNPEVKRRSQHKRRAAGLKGGLSMGITKKLMALQRARCANCRTSLRRIKFHLDHVMPLALGGTNIDSNIQLLCQPCNQTKHAKHPVDFAQSQGRLL